MLRVARRAGTGFCVTSSFKLTADAERDVIDIYFYSLENFGVVQAEKYSEELFARFSRIAESPDLGRDFGAIHPGAFRVNQGSHAIYYKRQGDYILVLRILHQMMDPARHLDE